MQNKKPISCDGFDVLVKELRHLQEVDRPAILIAVAEARAQGDLSENADYSAAKEKQRSIDRRMRFLEETIQSAQVIDVADLSGDKITFGAHVVAEDEDGNVLSCQLLSDIESDGRAVISCTSPTGRAMIGKCVGDTCVVKTPGGEKEYEILEVKFKK